MTVWSVRGYGLHAMKEISPYQIIQCLQSRCLESVLQGSELVL